MDDFDPILFLSMFYPGGRFNKAEHLGGSGSWRSSWRCERVRPLPGDKKDAIPLSVIVKYTEDFTARVPGGIAVVWDSPCLSDIEAKVLELFSGPHGTLHHLNSPECVRVPRLLRKETTRNARVIEDLGRHMIALDRLFTPEFMQDCKIPISLVEDRCGEIGRRIGTFMGSLNTRETKKVLRREGILPKVIVGDDDAIERVTKWITNRLSQCDPEKAARELTCHNEVFGGTMARFLAYFHVLLLSQPRGSKLYQAVWAFVDEVTKTFAKVSETDLAVSKYLGWKYIGWVKETGVFGEFRSALIAHGMWIIYFALGERKRVGGIADTIAWEGIRYVERAQDSAGKMMEELLWPEDKRLGVMRRLFGLPEEYQV
ncbi:hypothetical protein QBC34DRAFT_375216 [Podospora aff. communis PSN243]|uniref:Uncharacterized protein n=1 Tax=Podospora aff. communis PSN243 TaxID=3040156 RepID=A0AAV9H6Q9_9PEZI|nr:hypothetical protein QBC34DRAFT_375216 [Podospora aff. communis PSN243]